MQSIFVVDLLHEIELGVWKALLIHLLRILESVDENLHHELDARFRKVPTFGRDTIRCFTRNTSELKKMAAHNYEDILQCIIPVFDGLLSDKPPNSLNTRILRLLFHLAHWHSLAKLRLHSSISLDKLDQQTTILGNCLRDFRTNICPLFSTRELRREAAARERRTPKQATGKEKKKDLSSTQPAKQTSSLESMPLSTDQAAERAAGVMELDTATWSANPPLPSEVPSTPRTSEQEAVKTIAEKPRTSRKDKAFNLSTYKTHALGDYMSTIRALGTMDSYSTETGELEHRVPKSNYKRTSKKSYQHQLAQIEWCQSRLEQIRPTHKPTDASPLLADPAAADLGVRYHISISEHMKTDICTFLQGNAGDPAIVRHLLQRIKLKLKIRNDTPIPVDPRSPNGETMFFKGDALYQHNDVLNPRTDHRDIMLL
ncbi:hypothetical protein DXG01_016060 [Tephrocybe rancida]|nr:hypothetical protein DXG01_016060 [Tephrocybe rancida]